MIMKRRSLTKRHVTRTHRVALDWLFDRLHFDPKIQIRYGDTKNQLVDILTKGSFSKDEWNKVLRLLNIMTVSSFSRSHFSHFVSDLSKNPKPMSEGQEQNVGEGSAVAKPKPLSPVQAKTRPRVLVSQASHDSSRWGVGSDTNTALSNPESPGRAMTMQTGVTQSFRQRTATESDMTDSVRHSQVKTQENVQSPESRKQDGVISSNDSFRQRTAKSVSATDVKTEFCNLKITDINYVSKIFRFLMKKLGVPEGQESFATEAHKNNIMMWGLLVSSTMKAAIHLGLNYEKNIKILKCRNSENVGNLFTLTEILVTESSTEILSVSTIDCRSSCWTESTLAPDQVKKWSKGKGTNPPGLSTMSRENEFFKKRSKRKMVQSSERVQDVLRSIRVLWNWWRSNWIRVEYFPGFTSLQISQETQRDLQCQNVEPERFSDRIIL